MKTNFYVESGAKSILTDDVTLLFKEHWKNEGNLIKDIKTLELYLKPEESKCYYVVNQDIKGFIAV